MPRLRIYRTMEAQLSRSCTSIRAIFAYFGGFSDVPSFTLAAFCRLTACVGISLARSSRIWISRTASFTLARTLVTVLSAANMGGAEARAHGRERVEGKSHERTPDGGMAGGRARAPARIAAAHEGLAGGFAGGAREALKSVPVIWARTAWCWRRQGRAVGRGAFAGCRPHLC